MSFSVEEFSPELMRAVNYAADHGVACVASRRQRRAAGPGLPGGPGQRPEHRLDHLRRPPEPLLQLRQRPRDPGGPGRGHRDVLPGGGWALASGTSFSAPWISGAAALFASRNNRHHEPDATDFYLASEALSRAVPSGGQPGRRRRASGGPNLPQAIQGLKGGLAYDAPDRADYAIGLTFAGGCAATYPPAAVGRLRRAAPHPAFGSRTAR